MRKSRGLKKVNFFFSNLFFKGWGVVGIEAKKQWDGHKVLDLCENNYRKFLAILKTWKGHIPSLNSFASFFLQHNKIKL